jgi:hypothetical protein
MIWDTTRRRESDAMKRMKDLHITIHNGGDDAVAAVERMGKDWREQLEQAASEIERLRLTDEEREALHWFAHYGLPEHRAAALRRLLERLA